MRIYFDWFLQDPVRFLLAFVGLPISLFAAYVLERRIRNRPRLSVRFEGGGWGSRSGGPDTIEVTGGVAAVIRNNSQWNAFDVQLLWPPGATPLPFERRDLAMLPALATQRLECQQLRRTYPAVEWNKLSERDKSACNPAEAIQGDFGVTYRNEYHRRFAIRVWYRGLHAQSWDVRRLPHDWR
jgi:hypothetical protein